MVVQVKVIGFEGETMRIDLCNSEEELQTMTVLQLKKKIVECFDDPEGGTGPDRGTVGDPLHLSEGAGLAGPEEFKVLVDAAIVVAAIRAWSQPAPLPKRQRPAGASERQKERSKRDDMGKIYQVEVYGLRGERMLVDLCNTEEQMQKMTVLQLKEKIAQRMPDGAGTDQMRLIFTDKMLDGGSSLLSEYGIQHMSVIQIVIKVPGGLTA
ncbi:uncharacterized protein PAE49_020943 [Odontesthes bonariensis]